MLTSVETNIAVLTFCDAEMPSIVASSPNSSTRMSGVTAVGVAVSRTNVLATAAS